jgi:predicted NUDIX family NTP pyrophosphohydrolase
MPSNLKLWLPGAILVLARQSGLIVLMAKQSAGILMYRRAQKGVEVLLVHPGGPFWAKKDRGAWSIPKGEFTEGEEPLVAAKREFSEEVGLPVPLGELMSLGSVKQSSGKTVYVWAVEGEVDIAKIKSNTFEMEWPPKSGTLQTFPEIDKAGWFSLADAQAKLVKGQVAFMRNFAERLGVDIASSALRDQPSATSQTKQQTSLF